MFRWRLLRVSVPCNHTGTGEYPCQREQRGRKRYIFHGRSPEQGGHVTITLEVEHVTTVKLRVKIGDGCVSMLQSFSERADVHAVARPSAPAPFWVPWPAAHGCGFGRAARARRIAAAQSQPNTAALCSAQVCDLSENAAAPVPASPSGISALSGTGQKCGYLC